MASKWENYQDYKASVITAPGMAILATPKLF